MSTSARFVIGRRTRDDHGSVKSKSWEPQRPGRVAATVSRLLAMAILGAVPLAAVAQTRSSDLPDSLRSSITGTVRDSLGFPIGGVSVLITPGGHIYRTDSAGRFNALNLPVGALTIGLRKLGFSPLRSQVNLHIGVELTLDLVMQRLPQMLAEVEVRVDRKCPRYSLEGILCRRETGRGFFMNRLEILAKAESVYFPQLVLRDAPGFRQNLNGNPKAVESTVGWRCITWIFDGGFPYSYNPVHKPTDIYAIEVFEWPDVPPEYRHHAWLCTLVVMWSMPEAQRQLKRLATVK